VKKDLLCRAFTADWSSRGLRQEVTFVVHDDKPVGLDGVQVEFDDERVVCDAGVMVVATLAQRLDVEALAQQVVRLRRDRPGAANAGRKVMALIYAMVLGADSIDDVGVLRAGRTGRLLGGWVPAPSTLGTFLRAFTFGHVRPRPTDPLVQEAHQPRRPAVVLLRPGSPGNRWAPWSNCDRP